MKILSLRLKNLNSLAGEWSIDFTAPQYEADGIFLITGPTGSGKTTILDAICLAFYGRTPRQKSFSNSVNEIMPSDQKDCMAEATFEAGGVRYRSMWSHKRTGGKAQNPFTTPQLLLENADTGAALGKNEDAKKQIQKIIAMNFEQFTRSMLLAQGNFAAFLQSKPNERAEILEKITGTEIYSRISSAVFEFEKAKREEIKLRQIEIEGIEILDENALAELKNQRQANESEGEQLRAALEKQKELLDWKKNILKLKEEMSSILAEEEELEAEDKAFDTGREKLALADRAMAVEASWALLDAVRNDFKQQADKLELCKNALPKIQLRRDKAADNLAKVSGELEKSAQLIINKREMLTRAQGVDSLIKDKEQSLRGNEEEGKKLAAKLDQFKAEISSLRAKLEKGESQEAELDKWLSENAKNEEIANKLPLLERSRNEIQALSQNITDKNGELENLQKDIQEYGEFLAQLDEEIKKLAKDAMNIEVKKLEFQAELKKMPGDEKLEALNAALETLRSRKQESLILNREDVRTLRASLQDNSPCPVCGAMHHPYAEGQIPVIDELDQEIQNLSQRIKAVQDIERKLTASEKELNELKILGKDKEIEKNRQETQIKVAESRIAELQNSIGKEKESLLDAKRECERILEEFGLNREANMEEAFSRLQAMSEDWKNKANLRERLKNEITEVKTLLHGNEVRQSEMEENLRDLDGKGAIIKKDLAALIEERQREFGDLNEEKLKELEKTASQLREDKKAAEIADTAIDRELTKSQTELRQAQEGLEKLQKELENKSREFGDELIKEKFSDELAFLNAKMDREERESLREKSRLLQERKVQLQTLKTEKEKKLKIESARHETSDSLDMLEEGHKKLSESLSDVLQKIAGIKSQLQNNADNVKKVGGKKEELELLKKDHLVYAELNDLIGQQNGDKFRKFAQGLTLEILVAHANRQLKKMNDRYLLLIDRQKALELNISDNYKAGESRSTSNLSGGESFIISLALALGLASLSSKKTQLDSLFLDEGFGTLDEESLETTLATLENLKHEGKLIGIISHVGLLRDRINTQIELSGSGGRSVMHGPGCSRL